MVKAVVVLKGEPNVTGTIFFEQQVCLCFINQLVCLNDDY